MNRSLKGFSHIFSGRRGKIILIFIVVGVLLLCISSFGVGEEEVKGDSLADYKVRLEEELCEFISSVEGAGRCKVMISFSEGERSEYRGTVKTADYPPKILGVTVLCKGGEKESVRRDITEMLSSLYDIGSNRICVLKLS